MSRYAPRLTLRRTALPPTATVYPLHAATMSVYDIDPVPGQPGQPKPAPEDDVFGRALGAIGSQVNVMTLARALPVTSGAVTGQDDAETDAREHYLSANACIPARLLAAPSLLFVDLVLKDERTRRRVTRLLSAAMESSREFCQAEVVDLVGRAEGLCSILRRVFVELPLFPSRRLGEVKMYRVRDEAVQELKSLMEVQHGAV